MSIIKKTFSLAAAGILVLGISSTAPANQDVDLFVNQNKIECQQPAYLEDSSHVTYIPVRAVTEALEGRVAWDGGSQTITLERKGKTIKLKIESNRVTVDGKEALLSAPVKLSPETGRSLVPLNFFSDILGCQVKVSATAGVGILDEGHSDTYQ